MRWAWVGPSRELVGDLVVSLREMRANKGFKKRHDLHFYKIVWLLDRWRGGGGVGVSRGADSGGGVGKQNKRETEGGEEKSARGQLVVQLGHDGNFDWEMAVEA